ncbi:MAG TPA: YraN family protein [Rhizomicrobium sp.]|jgi:putative endonuclease|nr:YraN family protein [Rhizomicrobium sp.]
MKADRVTAKRVDAEKRGRSSETLAALLLRLKGYRILGRRVRTRAGEIDLVARSPQGVLCFVEVKARGAARDAALSVAPRQQARIARAASLFVAGKPGLARAAMRFDIVTVSPRTLPRHIRDAWRP